MNYLTITVDTNSQYGVYYTLSENGNDNHFEPFKSLHGLSEDEIVAYSLDHVEWLTKKKVGTYQVVTVEGEE